MSHRLCPKCGGSGVDPTAVLIKRCFACEGSGAVRVSEPSLTPQGQLLVATLRRRSARTLLSLLNRRQRESLQVNTLAARASGEVTCLGEYASGPVTGAGAVPDQALADLVLSKDTDAADGDEGGPLDRQSSFKSCVSDADFEEGVVIVTKQAAHARRASLHAKSPHAGPQVENTSAISIPDEEGGGGEGPLLRRKGTMFRPSRARELPGDLCSNVPDVCECMCVDSWDFTAPQRNVDHLRSGGALFACCPGPGTVLKDTERGMISTFLNMSAFADESVENGVLPIDMNSEADLSAHIFLLSKAMYLLPDTAPEDIADVALYSSYEFQKAVQPAASKVFEPSKVKDRDGKRVADTFCVQRQIIPWVLSITTQYRVSLVPQDALGSLRALCDGLLISRALLLERTKQDRGQDATKRAKQLVLVHQIAGGGILVTQVGFSVFTSLPSVARRLIHKIGAKGAADVQETAKHTRGWLRARSAASP